MSSSVTFGQVVRLALPAAAAAAATPLLGLIDAWALGRSPDPLEVGAVGLAASVFSILYWTFGFLRMSTAGLTAQAVGGNNEAEARAVLVRSVLLAATFGVVLIITRPILEPIAFGLLKTGSAASADTFAAARTYVSIRLWAAPAALANYVAVGWLTGRGRTAVVMWATLGMTVLNAVLDGYFVVRHGMGAEGVAIGTAIAEIAGFLMTAMGMVFVMSADGLRDHWRTAFEWQPRAFRALLATNRDIFIRTLLLVASFAFFTQRSSGWGDVVLAANQILMQLFLLTGLALDGPAIAAESLIGRAIAQRDRAAFRDTLRYAGAASALAAAPFVAAYALFGPTIIEGLTTSTAIADTARTYLPWVIVSPVVVALCFLLDGIFVGAARGTDMRNSMIVSTALYLIAWFGLTSAFGAHGHWAAFMLFFIVRGITLAIRLPDVAPHATPL